MKKIYDITKSELLASYSNGCCHDDLFYYEDNLYKTKDGKFFIFSLGGAGSKYKKQINQNNWENGTKITPIKNEKEFFTLCEKDELKKI